jgi:serine/threonine protein phosphatase PrpC
LFRIATINEPSGARSLDRVVARESDDGLMIVLADGAGGMTGGGEAAEAMARACDAWSAKDALASNGAAVATWIEAADRGITVSRQCGQCTAVVVVANASRLVGASVGDSIAWICDTEVVDLTERQRRKPLVGSGEVVVVSFAREFRNGRLLVASDGLWKYAPRERIRDAALTTDIDVATQRLVDVARLRSGQLQDDIALVALQ